MKLSRRDFIKRPAATSGAVLAAGYATAEPKTNAMAEAKARPKAPGEGDWEATSCRGCTF